MFTESHPVCHGKFGVYTSKLHYGACRLTKSRYHTSPFQLSQHLTHGCGKMHWLNHPLLHTFPAVPTTHFSSKFMRYLLILIPAALLLPGCDDTERERTADYASLSARIIAVARETHLNTCILLLNERIPGVRVTAILPVAGGASITNLEASSRGRYSFQLTPTFLPRNTTCLPRPFPDPTR